MSMFLWNNSSTIVFSLYSGPNLAQVRKNAFDTDFAQIKYPKLDTCNSVNLANAAVGSNCACYTLWLLQKESNVTCQVEFLTHEKNRQYATRVTRLKSHSVADTRGERYFVAEEMLWVPSSIHVLMNSCFSLLLMFHQLTDIFCKFLQIQSKYMIIYIYKRVFAWANPFVQIKLCTLKH